MSSHQSFDQAFDDAIDALRAGDVASSVLAAQPEHRAELLPLLRIAAEVHGTSPVVPAPSARLGQNFRLVRAAVRDAQELSRTSAPWWRRPITFASLSLPAGILALVVVGAAGAAAGGAVAVSQTGVPAAVEHIVTLGAVGGGSSSAGHKGRATPSAGASGQGPSDATGVPGVAGVPTQGHESNNGGGAESGMPENPNAPTSITVSGTVTDVHGGVFTLQAPDGGWRVHIDGNTAVTGTLADGATAKVSGALTAAKELHAATVDVTAAPETPVPATGATETPVAGPPGNPEHTPGNGNGNGNGTPPKTPASGNGNGNGDGNGTPPKTPASGNPNAGANGPPGAGNSASDGNGNGGGHKQTP